MVLHIFLVVFHHMLLGLLCLILCSLFLCFGLYNLVLLGLHNYYIILVCLNLSFLLMLFQNLFRFLFCFLLLFRFWQNLVLVYNISLVLLFLVIRYILCLLFLDFLVYFLMYILLCLFVRILLCLCMCIDFLL